MDLPFKVTLTRPITLDGETYSELSFDEPTLDDQIAGSELEHTLSDIPENVADGKACRFWIARLACVSETLAGRLRGADLKAAEQAVRLVLGVASAPKDEAQAAGNGTTSD